MTDEDAHRRGTPALRTTQLAQRPGHWIRTHVLRQQRSTDDLQRRSAVDGVPRPLRSGVREDADCR